MQAVAPRPELKLPAAQSVQFDASLKPSASPKVPTGQGVAAVLPSSQKLPTGHAPAQLLFVSEGWSPRRPAGQAIGAVLRY